MGVALPGITPRRAWTRPRAPFPPPPPRLPGGTYRGGSGPARTSGRFRAGEGEGRGSGRAQPERRACALPCPRSAARWEGVEGAEAGHVGGEALGPRVRVPPPPVPVRGRGPIPASTPKPPPEGTGPARSPKGGSREGDSTIPLGSLSQRSLTVR